MRKLYQLIIITFILLLTFACSDQKTESKESEKPKPEKSVHFSTATYNFENDSSLFNNGSVLVTLEIKKDNDGLYYLSYVNKRGDNCPADTTLLEEGDLCPKAERNTEAKITVGIKKTIHGEPVKCAKNYQSAQEDFYNWEIYGIQLGDGSVDDDDFKWGRINATSFSTGKECSNQGFCEPRNIRDRTYNTASIDNLFKHNTLVSYRVIMTCGIHPRWGDDGSSPMLRKMIKDCEPNVPVKGKKGAVMCFHPRIKNEIITNIISNPERIISGNH